MTEPVGLSPPPPAPPPANLDPNPPLKHPAVTEHILESTFNKFSLLPCLSAHDGNILTSDTDFTDSSV